MNRYFSSFIISSISYIVILGIIFYLYSTNDYSTKTTQQENVQCVHFAVIEPTTVKQVEPVKKKKIKPKPKKKERPLPKPKPVVKQKPVIEKPIVKPEEPLVEEFEEEEIEEVQEQEIVKTEKISDVVQQVNQNVKEAKKREFIAHLIKKINSNKTYPNMARRRGMEGVVDVKFKILSDGNVNDICVVTGKNIFKRSTIQAIEKSFPMQVDSALFDFPEVFKVKISYILK